MYKIDRRGLLERAIDFNRLTRFNRRLARLAALLPPGATATFADKLTKAELREWVETETEFRSWLYSNKLLD